MASKTFFASEDTSIVDEDGIVDAIRLSTSETKNGFSPAAHVSSEGTFCETHGVVDVFRVGFAVDDFDEDSVRDQCVVLFINFHDAVERAVNSVLTCHMSTLRTVACSLALRPYTTKKYR